MNSDYLLVFFFCAGTIFHFSQNIDVGNHLVVSELMSGDDDDNSNLMSIDNNFGAMGRSFVPLCSMGARALSATRPGLAQAQAHLAPARGAATGATATTTATIACERSNWRSLPFEKRRGHSCCKI